MSDPKQFAEGTFKAAQSPSAWLMSAERLRDGAEAIFTHEQPYELAYLRAHDVATKEAVAMAYSEGKDAGIVEIKARTPNYPAAQLLYAYALENLLKGIMVSNDPTLVSGGKLNPKLQTHDLLKLAKAAGFTLHAQEIPIAEALAKLSVWAGRYPVALFQNSFVTAPNADALLDYGSQHPTLRELFDRCHTALASQLTKPFSTRFDSIVVFRQPGT